MEFIDNDLTIQPLKSVTTNLFAYCEHHTYGFILNTGVGNYDDLVQVRWEGTNIPLVPRSRPMARATPPPKISHPNLIIKVGKSLLVKILKIQGPTVFGLHTVDMAIGNAGAKEILTKDIHLIFSGKDQSYSAESAFDHDKIIPKSQIHARFVLKVNQAQPLNIDIQYEKTQGQARIARKFL